jgi:hypothetical protein
MEKQYTFSVEVVNTGMASVIASTEKEARKAVLEMHPRQLDMDGDFYWTAGDIYLEEVSEA